MVKGSDPGCQKLFDTVVSTGRHIGLSCIFVVQNYKYINTQIRGQLTNVFFVGLNKLNQALQRYVPEMVSNITKSKA